MKRLILSCCLVAATCISAFAQADKVSAPSKAEFTAKVTELDNYITKGDVKMANSTFDEVKVMMQNVLIARKDQIRTASTDAAKASLTNAMQSEAVYYGQVRRGSQDLVKHHAEVKKGLDDFAGTL